MRTFFPSQNGLKDTSALKEKYDKFSTTNTVDIFDSGHFNPTPRILKQVAAVMKRQSFELRVINMQQQQAGDDWAIISCLCSRLMLGKDPFSFHYNQEMMWDI